MKRLYGTLTFFLYYFSTNAQINFTQLPQDLQLYPRNEKNQAEVVVSGTVSTTGYDAIRLLVIREGIIKQVLSQALTANEVNSLFRFAATIKAEPAEYSFQVFLHKKNDSTLIVKRQRIVCGDVYIIHGQSNAVAQAGMEQYYGFDFDDKYIRNCAYDYSLGPSSMNWYPAKDPYSSVGGFGLTLQRLILQTYGIPTVVLNGAFGGTGIVALSARDPNNHANPITYYGSLLYRAQWGGVADKVKAIIWKQGEDEAGNGPDGYDTKFSMLYKQLREDYGETFRLYVSQIDVMNNGKSGAAALRDFQRRTKYLYKNVETIATNGTQEYDGIHYGPLGHQQMAYEQFRQIARDFYGSTDTLQINSPDPKKVFYNSRKDSITLVFDDNMQMIWRDTAFYSFATGQMIGQRLLKNVFYLDKQSDWVTSGQARQNRVLLSLKKPASATRIRYLPSYYIDDLLSFYSVPALRNSRGMRAFSFDSLAIAEAIPTVTTLTARPVTEKQIQLSWQIPVGATAQLLERADSTGPFRLLATLPGNMASYTDDNLANPFGTYMYRLRAYSPVSESTYSNVVSARPLVLALTTLLVKLYPNPLADDRTLRIESDHLMFIGVQLYDLLGREVKKWQGTASKMLTLQLNGLSTGLYVADVKTIDGRMLRYKLMIR